jgi:hypothetical protein
VLKEQGKTLVNPNADGFSCIFNCSQIPGP